MIDRSQPFRETPFSFLYESTRSVTKVLIEIPKGAVRDEKDWFLSQHQQNKQKRHLNLLLVLGVCLDCDFAPFCIIHEYAGNLPAVPLFERLRWTMGVADR